MQHPSRMEPSQMSLDARDIHLGLRSTQSRGSRSINNYGGIRIQSGGRGNFAVAFADTTHADVAESTRHHDLDLSLPFPERDNVY